MNNYLKLLLFSAAVAGASLTLKHLGIGEKVHATVYFAIIFFTVQSILLLWLEDKLVNNDSQNFVFFVIGSISFRLLTSLFATVIYLVAVAKENTSFILTFFGLYLLFLGFELFTLMTNLRSNSKSVQIDE